MLPKAVEVNVEMKRCIDQMSYGDRFCVIRNTGMFILLYIPKDTNKVDLTLYEKHTIGGATEHQ